MTVDTTRSKFARCVDIACNLNSTDERHCAVVSRIYPHLSSDEAEALCSDRAASVSLVSRVAEKTAMKPSTVQDVLNRIVLQDLTDHRSEYHRFTAAYTTAGSPNESAQAFLNELQPNIWFLL